MSTISSNIIYNNFEIMAKNTEINKIIADRVAKEKEKKSRDKELKESAKIFVDELGVSEKEAIDMVIESENQILEESKTKEGEEIMKNIGFKMPDKIFMSYWNKITAIRKEADLGNKSDIDTIGDFYVALNTGNVNNKELAHKIKEMDMKAFEKISLYIGKVLNEEASKKK